MRPVAVVFALVLAAAGVAAAQAPPRTSDVWAFRRPIAVPTLAQPGFVELAIDGDVYREATASLQDLRVREPGGADVAYVVRRHERRAAEATRDARLHDLVTTSERAVRFVQSKVRVDRLEAVVEAHVMCAARVREVCFRAPVIECADAAKAQL